MQATPEELLLGLSQECVKLGVVANDVYGDFQQKPEQSYLRRFEREVCETFDKEDVSSPCKQLIVPSLS